MTSPRAFVIGFALVGVLAVGCGDDGGGPTTTVTEADPDPTPGAATDNGVGDDD